MSDNSLKSGHVDVSGLSNRSRRLKIKRKKSYKNAKKDDDELDEGVAFGDAAIFKQQTSSYDSENLDPESQDSHSRNPTKFFKVETKLGKGSYGSVYRAKYLITGETVALKIVDVQASPDELKELDKEIILMTKLKSPLIVEYVGSYKAGKQVWIAIEYMDAGSCLDCIRHLKQGLNERYVARICHQVLKGIAYLHSEGVLHRDIKAANILLNSSGAVKVADFGVSATVSGTLKATGTQVGSPFWMAPEVIKEQPYSENVDIWALGITAIELAEQKPPLHDNGPIRALFLIASKPPPTLSDPTHASDEFNTFVAAALVKEPEERPSATTLLQHAFVREAVDNAPLVELVETMFQLATSDDASWSASSFGGGSGRLGGTGRLGGAGSGELSGAGSGSFDPRNSPLLKPKQTLIVGEPVEGGVLKLELGRRAAQRDVRYAWFRRAAARGGKKRGGGAWERVSNGDGATYTATLDDVDCQLKAVAYVSHDNDDDNDSLLSEESMGQPLTSASTTSAVTAAAPSISELRVLGAPYVGTAWRVAYNYFGGVEAQSTIKWWMETGHNTNKFRSAPMDWLQDDHRSLLGDDTLVGRRLRVTVTPQRADGAVGTERRLVTDAGIKPKGRVLMYTAKGCTHCMRAQDMLEAAGAPVSLISLSDYPFRKDEMKSLTGKRSVPQIFFNDKHIGGVAALETMKSKGKLSEIIAKTLAEDAPETPTVPIARSKFSLYDYIDKKELPIVKLYRKAIHPQHGLITKNRGPITKRVKCFKGKDLKDWLESQKEMANVDYRTIATAMQKYGYFESVSKNAPTIFASDKTLYQWVADTDTNCLNLKRRWTDNSRAPEEIAVDMQRLMLSMADKYIADDGRKVNYSAIANSDEILAYEHAAIQLQTASLDKLSQTQLKCFFINLYNSLVIHATATVGPPQSAMQRARFFGGVGYTIDGNVYTLNAIEHGILRGNRKPPAALRKVISKYDPRRRFVMQEFDERIHFALVCGAKSCPAVRVYDPSNIDDALESATIGFLSDEIEVDTNKRVITSSMLLKWYKSDFPSGSALLPWLSKFVSGQLKNDIDFLSSTGGKYKIQYRKYLWDVNSGVSQLANMDIDA